MALNSAAGRAAAPMRSVLLIAFHFPPIRGSSGVQRTLRFAQHLPKFGWRPIVLTVVPSAYEQTSAGQGNEVSPDLEVVRAFGFDTARQLSLFGRYPRSLAIPDRWATWRYWGARAARKLIAERHVDLIWSTFPIATAHEIGLSAALTTGRPWIAEFRDPMWQGDYPPDPRVNRYWLELEQRIFSRANQVVVTTPSAARDYAGRYNSASSAKTVVVENGYDEETFARATSSDAQTVVEGNKFTLLHSGLIYPSERDPTHFFQALAALKQRGELSGESVRIVLRASGNESAFGETLRRLGIDDIVSLEPAVDYLQALREMLSVDGLLIMQAANCNAQIPAKLYEYLRATRPILGLTDPAGDTAATLRAAGINTIVRLDSQSEIEAALPRFIGDVRSGKVDMASETAIKAYSREQQTGQLAELFNRVSAAAPN